MHRRYILSFKLQGLSFHDLESVAGMRVLEARIMTAAKAYCPSYLQIRSHQDVDECVQAVVRDLMQREPEILLPVMLLHHDASALYHREQIWHQAGRSRRLAGVLAMGLFSASAGSRNRSKQWNSLSQPRASIFM